MGELNGKTALITGGGRGFGRAVALLLAREGADLALADLGAKPTPRSGYRPASKDDLERTAGEVRALGRRCIAIEADVTRGSDCERMAREAMDGLGRLDILVANAGAATNAPVWKITEEEWDFVHGVNLKGIFLTTKFVIPHMMERRSGKIVVTASRNGLRAERNYAHYNAAKAGAIQFAKSLALELGEYDINVNAICPTQMADKTLVRKRDPESGKYWDQVAGHENATYEEFDLAAGRDNLFTKGGQPDFSEVAEGVLWLVSDRARLVTGLALPMDAGWIVKRGGDEEGESVDSDRLTKWLDAYKRAWETQDADAFVALFTPDCEYRDTPFVEPVPGKEFHAFWKALARIQQDNRIEFEVLGRVTGNHAIVNWRANSTRRGTAERREGNGIFVLTFAPDGRCSDLREWQHWHAVGTPLEKRSFGWKSS